MPWIIVRDGEPPSLTMRLGRVGVKAYRSISLILLVTGTTLSACAGPGTPPVPIPTAVPDPCASENIEGTAGAINSLMQQFDDESALASNVTRSQLAARIAALQSIRRQAQDHDAPTCVAQLKQLQLIHMDSVIETMLAFMSRGDQAAVARGIQLGREQHDQYVVELARLLGMTALAVTPQPASPVTSASVEARAGTAQTAIPVSGFVAVNPGPVLITLRSLPATSGEVVATLPVGGSAAALGGSPDGEWVHVVVPDHPYQTAWVLASLVQITVPTPQQ
jgi:hypothetical protein